MKCQYIGWYSRAGCNEDAAPGNRFCHAHRKQGEGNEAMQKVARGCFLIVLIIVLLLVGLVFLVAITA